MEFKDVIGHESLKKQLAQNIELGRTPHALIFNGKDGYGVLRLALAYAEHLVRYSATNPSVVDALNHADIHLFFPVVKKGNGSSSPLSKDYLAEFKSFVAEQPYGHLNDWLEYIEAGNKQGVITVDEAQVIMKTLALKSYTGNHKVLIVWHADKMTTACANKLLKWIEEPNPKTTIILLSEQPETLLKTIQSRCQLIPVKALSESDIYNTMILKGVDSNRAKIIASNSEGDLQQAFNKITKNDTQILFDKLFVEWVRTAFQAKSQKNSINILMSWSDKVSKLGRESVKSFLSYGLEIFRQGLLLNYGVPNFVHLQISDSSFSLEKFSKFVGGQNIEAICNEMQQAINHIERNGNGKIVLTDLSIKLTRLLHQTTQ